MIIAGYFASVLIGISLGLIGGGGSILTVPVLVYLFGLDATYATVYSLFIVGSTSSVGFFSYLKKGLVNFKTAVLFGGPSIIAVFITRIFLVPIIPEVVLRLEYFTLTKNIVIMLLFAILMVLASTNMIFGKIENPARDGDNKLQLGGIVFYGLFVGVITGFIGAGGGFLIIPALVNFLKLPIKVAIGTSLLIIAVNSLSGFLFSFQHHDIKWLFIFSITAIAILGIIIGSYLNTKVDGKKLKPAFGWFVLILGIYILVKETYF
jgi:uncharacterized membrane protein YfcA